MRGRVTTRLKLVAAVFFAVFLMAILPRVSFATETEEYELPIIHVSDVGGTLGDGVSWKLTGSTLVISGEGAMPDYRFGTTGPWNEEAERIQKISVKAGITSVGEYAFSNLPVESAELAGTVRSIGTGAFEGCENLSTVSLSEGLEGVAVYAFKACRSLEELWLPESLRWLGDAAFENSGLTSVSVPGGVESVPMYCFNNCTNLTEVTLGEGIWQVAGFAFQDCGKLGLVEFPASISEIDINAFKCYDEETGEYAFAEGLVFKGYGGSVAESVASANGIPFVKISTLADAVVSAKNQTYTGKALKPAVKVVLDGKTLSLGVDYTVSYANNKNAGKATFVVTGMGAVSGTKSGSFTIKPAAQSLAVTAAQVFVGKSVTLSVSGAKNALTFKSGDKRIATVSAKGVVKGVAPGTVKVTVTAAASKNYKSASKTVSLAVKCAEPAIKSLTNAVGGIKITIGKSTGAAAYRVFCKVGNGAFKKVADTTSTTYVAKTSDGKTALKSGKKYTFTVYCLGKDMKAASTYSKTGKSLCYAAATAFTKAANGKAGQVSLSWKKVTGAKGYEIQYSLKSNFSSGVKTVTVTGAGKVASLVKGLKKGKTYSFRIRSFVTDGGKNVYSAFGETVKCKVVK